MAISTAYRVLLCVGQYPSGHQQCLPSPSLPCVPTSASARPPRPSPRRELSCPWRRLTAWKLFSSSRLKTKITASAQPENLRGMREQMEGQTSLLLRMLFPGRLGEPAPSPSASADPSQPAYPIPQPSPWHRVPQLPLGLTPDESVHPPTSLSCAAHLSERVGSGSRSVVAGHQTSPSSLSFSYHALVLPCGLHSCVLIDHTA